MPTLYAGLTDHADAVASTEEVAGDGAKALAAPLGTSLSAHTYPRCRLGCEGSSSSLSTFSKAAGNVEGISVMLGNRQEEADLPWADEGASTALCKLVNRRGSSRRSPYEAPGVRALSTFPPY